MSNVDNRVVQMEFDNKEFEQGIQTSIKSLNNLEKSLKLEDASKGLTNIEKTANSISLGGLSSSVENINWHFTWLGRTVDRILDNITNKALSTAKQVASAFTIDSFTQGYEEYELKMGSIQTIMAGTGESLETVSRYLDELNTYADKTIYSFSDMTANIGKFTNAGVDLDSSVKAIQGVSNLAAVSGSNANEASRAMYNFAQALSAGYVKLIDWKSIENANMATVEFKQGLIDTAVEMGTLTKKADGLYQVVGKDAKHAFGATKEFNEYLSDAWLTNDVLIKTLGDYANEETEIGKKAFAAAQDVKTFTQLMDTLKEAMGSGWAKTFELIIGDFNQAKEMFTAVSNVLGGFIDNLSDSRNEMLEGALGGTATIFYEDWINLGDSAITQNQAFIKSLTDTARAHGIAIDEMIEESGSFAKSLDKGWLNLDILNEALESSGENATNSIEGTIQSLEDLNSIATKVIRGDFGNGADRVKALTEAGYDYETVQKAVNKILSNQELVLEDLSDAELKQAGYTEEEIAQLQALKKQAEETNTPLNDLIKGLEKPSGRDLLIDSIKNAFTGFVKTLTSVRDAYRDIFPPMTSDRLYSIIEGFNKFTKSLIPSERTLSRFKDIFRGLFSVVDIGKMAISSIVGGFKDVVKSISPMGDVVLDIGAKIGNFLYKIRNAIKDSNLFGRIVGVSFKLASYGFKQISNFIKMVSDRILGLAKDDTKGLGKFVKNVLNGIKPLSNIGSFVKDSFRILESYEPRTAIKILGNKIKNGFNKLKLPDFVKSSLSTIIEFGKNIIERIRSIFSGSGVGNVFGSVSNFISGIKDRFNGVSKIGEFVSNAFGFISEKISIAWNWLKGVFEKIKDSDAIGDVLEILKSLFTIDLIKNLSGFTKSLSGIGDLFEKAGGVLEGVTGVLDAVKNSLKAWQKELKAKTIKNIAIAIGILVAALFVLTKIDSQKLYDAMTYMGIMFVELAGAMAIFDKTIGDGKKLKDAGKALIPLAASILILSFAVGKFSKMDWGSIGKGATSIAILMGEIAAFTRLTNEGFTASNGVALVAMAVGIRLLIGAVSKFAKLDVGAAVTGMTELAILLTEIGVFTRISSKGFKAGNAVGILAVGLALSVFVGVVKSLSKLDVGAAVTGMTELAILLTEIGVFTRMASKAKGLVKTSLSLVVVGGALHIFISAIKKVSSISGGNLAKGLIAIGVALTELSIATKMMSGADSIKGAAAIGLLSTTLYLLIPLFRQLGSVNNIAQTGIGLSAVILSLSGAVKLLTGVPVGGGLSAAETLAEIVAGIALIVTAAGAIQQIPGVDWLMSEAEGFFTNLGKAIGGFIGGIVGGVAEGMASTLPQIGQCLTDFMTNAQGFIDSASEIGQNGSALNGIDTLVSAILKLTASELLDGITSWFTGEASLTKFAAQLPYLGQCLASFSTSMAGADLDAISNSAAAIETIAGVNIPKEGGLVQAITGTTNFSTFGQQLASFGPNLAAFADSISGASFDGISDASTALATLLNLEVGKTGGLVQAITGTTNFSTFGQQLASFGPNLAAFADSISGITSPENITGIFETIANLLAMDVPENKGFLPWLKGITDFGEFGNQLSGFGEGLSGFFTNIGGFDANNLGLILDQIRKLADMSASLSTFNINAFWNFGTALSSFDTIDLQPAIDIVNSWDDSFSTSGKSLGESVLSGIKESIGSGDLDLSGVGEIFVSTFTSSITSNVSAVKGKINGFINAVMSSALSRVKTYNNSFKTAGGNLASSIGEGISSKNISSGINSMLSAAVTTINGYYTRFKASGAYLVDGVIEGMLARKNLLNTTAKELAEGANKTFNDTLKINSPSKVMMQSGEWFVMGFVNGVLSLGTKVEQASSSVAYGALDAMRYGIEKVYALANSDMEFSPAIRPVVDLSSVENGIDQINGLFNQNGSISLGSYPYQNLQRTALSMRGTNSTPVMPEENGMAVLDAINDLRNDLIGLKTAIGSMKVVTETGALIGQIETKLDKRLGIISGYKRRGM